MRVYTVADSSTTSVPLCRITSHTVTINADITIAKIPITTADTSHPAVRATVRMIEGSGVWGVVVMVMVVVVVMVAKVGVWVGSCAGSCVRIACQYRIPNIGD